MTTDGTTDKRTKGTRACVVVEIWAILEKEPLAASVAVTRERLTVTFSDGRTISVTLEWYQRLLHASPHERKHWQLLGGGYAIEWTDLDEHVGITGLLAGKRSLNRWLAAREGA